MDERSPGQNNPMDDRTLLLVLGTAHFLLPLAIYFVLAQTMKKPFEPWHPLVMLPALGAFVYRGPSRTGAASARVRMLVRMSFGDFSILVAIILAGSTVGHAAGFLAGYSAMVFALVEALRETAEQEPPPVA